MIDDAQRAEILRLSRAERWPVGTIARHVSVHHDVVRRVMREEGIADLVLPRPSKVDRYLPFIQETWARYPRLGGVRR